MPSATRPRAPKAGTRRWRTSLAGSGAASTLAATASVALALVDMELPGAQDGTLLRALKREQPGLRVLLMSGRPRSDLKRFLQTGADAVLEKPFRLGELDQSLDVALASPLRALSA